MAGGEKPESLNLGVRGGLLVAVVRPDGAREVHGHLEILDADTAPRVREWLAEVQPWLDGTGLTDNREEWERKRRGVVTKPGAIE